MKGSERGIGMKAKELQQYLGTMDGGWVNWKRTVDTFKSGDPDTEITAVAIGWMSYHSSLKRALELNCNMFITHEPTYFNHHDQETEIFRLPYVRSKREFIEENGLIILRCHDLWDQVPDIGIPDSWARQLDFHEPLVKKSYYRVYDVSGRTAFDVAQQVARRTLELGQEAVQLIGPSEAKVTRVAIGTGAITPFLRFVERYKADLAICSDDGFMYWRDGALSIDMGIPVIIVNHAVSEMYGMKLLAEHLAAKFPDVPIHFIPQSCMYQLVHA